MRVGERSILIVGGGTAGWLTAAYLARYFDVARNPRVRVTVLESPEIGIIGVGEGTFPTIRNTLRYIGIDESHFVRSTSATFKQGIRFDNWVRTPEPGRDSHFLHPFEPPFHTDEHALVSYWLLQDEGTRPPFAEAMSIQNRVAEAGRAPKAQGEGDFSGPLNYAYHFDAASMADVLSRHACAQGVRRLQGLMTGVSLDPESGAIACVHTREHGDLAADFYIDCSGFRAGLIEGALGVPFTEVGDVLFTDRALACKLPYDSPDAPLPSYTVAAAHRAGWTWDIGLAGARGIGCVYSSAHMGDDEAAATLERYLGARGRGASPRLIPFRSGYRTRAWEKNCVAIGLSGGFLEPLESTGVVMIEAAAAMFVELFPHHGPADGPAKRFNALMAARHEAIVRFLKLHYCLSRREEPFWRDNAGRATIPEALRDLLDQWRYRPPSRFDFVLDHESFAYFNYQYILYGMEFRTDLSPARGDFPHAREAAEVFDRIRQLGNRAARDLPPHRTLIERIAAGGLSPA